MDELTEQLAPKREALHQHHNIIWCPIRHHSPACAWYVRQWLEQHQPQTVFIEGSIDFNQQLAALADVDTRPPVALYSGSGFYPLCDTSPEWQAMRWAFEQGKKVHFIDLPIKDPSWQLDEQLGQLCFVREGRLQHSEFVNQLIKKSGCRNSDELWERYFELKHFESPADFFNQVFDYCTSARLSYSQQAIDDSEDGAREAFMRGQLRQHIKPDQKCAVITGGFHTVALLDWQNQPKPKKPANIADSWLIRYSQDRLDANNGYGAGMQVPDYYERLYLMRHHSHAINLVLDTLATLEHNEQYQYPINTAAKQAICEQTINLAKLRGHQWPGLFDTLDAIASVLIKQHWHDDHPILAKARQVLAGDKLGNVSRKQPPLPLINEVRQMLAKLRFKLDATTKVTTDIELYQGKQQKRLAVLNQCLFLKVGFADKIRGPQWQPGIDLHLRHEQWQYAWTPQVEARLVDLALKGSNWQALLSKTLFEQQQQLAAQDLVAHQQFFVQLVLMDALGLAADIWQKLSQIIEKEHQCQPLCELLTLFIRLQKAQTPLFEPWQQQFSTLMKTSWQQLMYNLPTLTKAQPDEALVILLEVQQLAQSFEHYLDAPWQTLWCERLNWLLQHGQLNIMLTFGCKALLCELVEAQPSLAESSLAESSLAEQSLAEQAELISREQLLAELNALFNISQQDAFEALYAVITLVPHWLKDNQSNSLLMMLNQLLNHWHEAQFLEALPKLRSLFSQLDPAHIEQLSAMVCQINQWDEALDVFNPQIDTQQLLKAQQCQQQLVLQLEQQGLGHWINN